MAHTATKDQSLLKDISVRVIAGVVSALIVAGLAYLGNLVWRSATGLGFSVEVPLWLFSFLLVATGSLGLVFFRYVRSEYGKGPWWRCYVKGKFFHVKWDWLYGRNGEVINLSPHCPEDGSPLTFKDDFIEDSSTDKRTAAMSLKCEKCGKKFGPFAGEKSEDIYAEVERKIHQELLSQGKEWKNFMRGDWRLTNHRRLMSEKEISAQEVTYAKRLAQLDFRVK